MKTSRFLTLSLFLILNNSVFGQFFQSQNPGFDLTFAAGISSYYGDLVQDNPFFREPSYCLSAGIAYNHNPYLTFRANLSYLQIRAWDGNNKRADLIARNLNFKSNILDFDASVEYNIIDITADHKITPYLFVGFGGCHFNPYTTDRFGKKVYLQPMGTEGQGIAAYPDRKPYETTIFEWPFGLGLKYRVTDRIVLGFEFKYRYVNTDYLDDDSRGGYPDQSILAAKDPNLPLLTYRGDELPGGAPYPAPTLNRGNPKNKDSYYSAQFKLIYHLQNPNKIQINY
jgi:hypothetical protein